MIKFLSTWLILISLGWSLPTRADSTPQPDPALITQLTDKSFSIKAQAIEQLANSQLPYAQTWLQALSDGALFVSKTHPTQIVIIQNDQINDAITQAPLTVAKDDFQKITINNTLRKQLRTAIAKQNLSNPNPTIRKQAVEALLASLDASQLPLLQELQRTENDPSIKERLNISINLALLQSGTKAEKLTAIQALSNSLDPAVRSQLTSLATDTDPDLAQAAQRALKTIEGQIKLYHYAEIIFFGLSLGSILVLAAIGLAITFGVMGVINMAHGELIMLGAYTTYMVQKLMPNHIDYSLWVAIPAAFIVSGLMGILIERTIIRHLYGRPLETLLATFGVSLMLQQLVRTLISPQNVPVSNPSWMSGSWEINSVLSLTYNRLYIIAFSLLVFFALLFVLKKTKLGLQVRAVSQNRAMARAMGVRSGRVDALTFGLGSGIAGIAGVALSQLTNVGPNLGQAYIIDSFMVVVFGGVGNLWGTLVAGLSLGVLNKLLEPWAGAVLAKILVLIFIILFIQKRPRGLFPQKGRAAGD